MVVEQNTSHYLLVILLLLCLQVLIEGNKVGAAATNGGATDVVIDADDVTTDVMTSDVSYVIIDCSPMSYVDSPGMSTLAQAVSEYATVNIKVLLAGCKGTRDGIVGSKKGKGALWVADVLLAFAMFSSWTTKAFLMQRMYK